MYPGFRTCWMAYLWTRWFHGKTQFLSWFTARALTNRAPSCSNGDVPFHFPAKLKLLLLSQFFFLVVGKKKKDISKWRKGVGYSCYWGEQNLWLWPEEPNCKKKKRFCLDHSLPIVNFTIIVNLKIFVVNSVVSSNMLSKAVILAVLISYSVSANPIPTSSLERYMFYIVPECSGGTLGV